MPPRHDDWLRPSLVTDVLTISAVATVLVAWVVLSVEGGWTYYRTPLRVRAYEPAHRVLRPSGSIGHPLGVVGIAMMTVPVIYSVRKRWKPLARLGNMRRWLDVHLFCGTVGPVLVTFHAAMKFNGIISVAYWSMVAVVLSGFVGRYLYGRIPRTIRGAELSYREIESRAAELLADLAAAGVSTAPVEAAAGLRGLNGAWSRRRARHALIADGVDRARADTVLRLAADRALLLRRLSQLNQTKRLFSMWHAFHLPLVYVMFGIAILHIGLAVYLGYASFLPR